MLKNCVPPFKTKVLSPPDVQVEEQQKIQATPEDTKTSGDMTNSSNSKTIAGSKGFCGNKT